MLYETATGCRFPLTHVYSCVSVTNHLLGGNGIALSLGLRRLDNLGGAGAFVPFLTGVSLSFSLGTADARAGRSLGKPSPRSAAALRPAAPGSRCPPAAAVTTRQAAASCRAKLRGGAARERQHAARGLRKPAPP